VLIPLDGSTLAERAVEPALALGIGTHAEYTLLQILTPVGDLNYGPAGGEITGFGEALKQAVELEQVEAKRAHDYLEGRVRRLSARLQVVTTRVTRHDRPAHAILDDASRHGADLIALATSGWGGLKRLLLGSVADKVLRGAERAVLVCPPGDAPAPIAQ
jgi:nucleotide-binding universal stress UspA family protein